jgi:protein TonB
MERLLIGLALVALFIGACKSDNKEVTTETTADTTMVANAVVEISVDSAAMAAEEAEAQKSVSAKPATTGKSTAANPKSTGAAKTTPPAGTAEKGVEEKADLGYVEFPSKRATYPGGQAALNTYLSNNIKYPPLARENSIEGTVYARILVDEQGSIVDITYPKPLGYGLEEEVSRVVRAMPKLIPAEDQSKPVKTMYVLPVKFDLK